MKHEKNLYLIASVFFMVAALLSPVERYQMALLLGLICLSMHSILERLDRKRPE